MGHRAGSHGAVDNLPFGRLEGTRIPTEAQQAKPKRDCNAHFAPKSPILSMTLAWHLNDASRRSNN
jgi:hypothetical protein